MTARRARIAFSSAAVFVASLVVGAMSGSNGRWGWTLLSGIRRASKRGLDTHPRSAASIRILGLETRSTFTFRRRLSPHMFILQAK
jgi:hypothetical protein